MFDSCEWEKKKRKHKRYRLNWRILIAKPEHRSKHVYKLNEASKVTLMSIDIPQCKQFYVFIVTSAMLLISVHYIFSSGFFPFIQRGGGGARGGGGERGKCRGFELIGTQIFAVQLCFYVWNIAFSFLITNDWG